LNDTSFFSFFQSVNEADKSLTAYAIYTGSHYMLGTAKIDGEVRAVFQAEEAMEHRVSEGLLKYQGSPTS
jgi:hypothetical protein